VDHLFGQIRIGRQRFIESAERIFQPGINKDILGLFAVENEVVAVDVLPVEIVVLVLIFRGVFGGGVWGDGDGMTG